ncbi:hypothetical protein [uncultured Desulfuromonas sp.]|uniref:hypothetical protein n=1 Tax=uncultured Desulfuromonas sp. TaxID=181013 RepID=UPI00261A3030|nr:hypothetical protein [uncultured Desulfuromonas sp.]
MRLKMFLAVTMVALAGLCDLGGKARAMEPLLLEIVPTSVASVSEATVVQDGEGLLVKGAVRKFHRFYLPGHVDVMILDAGGNPLGRAKAPLSGYASRRGGVKEARFAARFECSAPQGATVKVRYHAAGSDAKEVENCS